MRANRDSFSWFVGQDTKHFGDIVRGVCGKFPMEIFYDFTFSETNGKTTMTMTGTPVNGTAEEVKGFSGLNESMQQGFGASLDKLDNYLRDIS